MIAAVPARRSCPGTIEVLRLLISGVAILIETDSRELLAYLGRFFSPWIVSSARGHEAGCFSIRGAGDRPRLWLNTAFICEAKDWDALFGVLLHEIESIVIRQVRGVAVVHAGAAVFGKAGVLLPGSSRSGKTSLVREIIRQGGEYFSDEYALIDAQGAVHPFLRPLMVRGEKGVVPTPAREIEATIGSAPRIPTFNFFLQYDPRARFKICEIDQSTALLRLLAHTPHRMDQEPSPIPAFCAAARWARNFEGVRGEADEAAAAIAELAARNA